MGRYLTQPPLKRLVKKQQVFTVSGTFTPSQALLDAGGAVEVRCIGGGGGGGDYYAYGGGSSGMDITRIVTVTGPVTVTIGAGGYGNAGRKSARLRPRRALFRRRQPGRGKCLYGWYIKASRPGRRKWWWWWWWY